MGNELRAMMTNKNAMAVRLLDVLYNSALNNAVEDFPLAIVDLLKATLSIDGAVFAVGTKATGTLRSVNTSGHLSERALPNGPTATPVLNMYTERYVANLDYPILVSPLKDGVPEPLTTLEKFIERECIQHLLVGGNAANRTANSSWVIVYRRSEQYFTNDDAATLHELWPHILRAAEINWCNALDALDGRRKSRSSALVDSNGTITAADPAFVALVREEWPATRGSSLPAKVYAQLVAKKVYIGRSIQIESVQTNNRLVFYARKSLGLNKLTPAEEQVARRFATGKSTKQVATELGVSPNTVRTQLSHLYSKLNVHDKAQLAQRLMAA